LIPRKAASSSGGSNAGKTFVDGGTMALWIVLALMTIGAMFAVLWPLRASVASDGRDDNDVAVYRDQLEEVERDRAAGLIGATEAEAARVEVSRRLLAAGAASSARSAAGDASPRPRRWAAAATLVMLPLGAVGLYLAIGSPALPGQPLSARVAAAHGDNEGVESAFARVEAHLAEHPEDGRGWEVIAPVYLRLGRYDDAVKARANALRLLGATAQRKADLGEAMVAAADGKVTAEAKALFDEAIRLDPTEISARFYQGLAAEQDGSRADAARIWRALIADAPEGARWIEPVRRALARVEPGAAGAAPDPGQSAPASAEDKMIRDMVARLAARLRQDGSDVDGWIQLVRSYTVLGQPEQVRTAIADARRALAGDPDKLRRFDDGVKTLGIGG
jgi:cytochrome c-type biogenesis protein CcmH